MAGPHFEMTYRTEYGIRTLMRRSPLRVLAWLARRALRVGRETALATLFRGAWVEERGVDLSPPESGSAGTNIEQKGGLLEGADCEKRGVLHVGGHDGQELEQYLALGFRKIVFFEGEPTAHARLLAHVGFWQRWLDLFDQRYGLAKAPELIAILQALGERRETAMLHVTTDDQQASLLTPVKVLGGVERSVEVEIDRLDEVMTREGLPFEDFNVLVIDVQGAELAVLRGAPRLIDRLDVILCEVAFERRYEGQPLMSEIDAFLGAAGFERSSTNRWSTRHASGDAIYRRATGA